MDEKKHTAQDKAHDKAHDRPESWARDSARLATERERLADSREVVADERERLADSRELELHDRAELARLRDEALRNRTEVAAVRAERERVIAQIREANERLVIATVRADELMEQAEAARVAAADNEERFRSLVTTSAAIVWHADPQGQISVDAEGWRTFTGLPPPADADAWREAVHPADRAAMQAQWLRAVATAAPYRSQHRIRTPSGGYAHVVSRAVPIVRDGVVREWIGTMTDVTDRVRIEEAREQFIAILGHDLRNPLTAIMGGAEVLRLGALPEQQAGVVIRIARSARRMETIIRDVMDFARGRLGGGIPVTPTPCDLGRICAEVVDELRLAHPNREIHFEGRGELHGAWDEARAGQVMSNLIGNSITHGTDPIRVSVQADGEDIVTIVHNPGTPIPSEALPTLFEPFVQGENIPDARPHGLGLGLYIVSEIVRAHGGTIAVASTEASGTTFEIRWPRTPRPPAPAPRRAFDA